MAGGSGDGPSIRRSGTPGEAAGSNINGTRQHDAMAGGPRNAGGSSGHKIAYDPLDLETRSEEAELPKLTLMEEIILLGIKE